MTKIVTVPLLSVILLAASEIACAEIATWTFMLSVGGVAIGEPVREGETWTLPVRADVSGLSKITVQPTALNSSLACRETRVTVERATIVIAFVTSPAGGGHEARCPAAALGRMAPGRYSVVYGGAGNTPADLGTIVIAP